MLCIEPLSRRHDRKDFDCGVEALNDYLMRMASQHMKKGMSRTFVLTDSDAPATILGFFTLAGCEVVTSGLPDEYSKKYPMKAPAAKLARLAVSAYRQRQGLGAIMMVESMKRCLETANNIGIIGVFVDAKNAKARDYYEQFGFIPLREDPLALFLPLKTLRIAMEESEL